MVAIVLMGAAGSKISKVKGKEPGQPGAATVKLGRYAMIVELLKALQLATRTSQTDSRVQSFVERLVSRVEIMLEAEVCGLRKM